MPPTPPPAQPDSPDQEQGTSALPSFGGSRHTKSRPPAGGLSPEKRAEYWRRNLRLVGGLLVLWAAVSFGCGILLHRWLDQWRLAGSGYPIGFWFAQQGAMFVFIGIVFFYARKMNQLDREFDAAED